MAALIRCVAVVLALAILPARVSGDVPGMSRPPLSPLAGVERWWPIIAEASRRFLVPEAWIAAVMQAESGGLTMLNGRPITSRAGAMGLMQVMPDTWDAMRRLHHLGPDPYDPHDNIMAGAAWLCLMHDRFGYPGLFAAYNAGPARYADHLTTGRSLPDETESYVARLARVPAMPTPPFPRSGGSPEPSPAPRTASSITRLFVPLHSSSESASSSPEPPPDPLFVPISSAPPSVFPQ